MSKLSIRDFLVKLNEEETKKDEPSVAAPETPVETPEQTEVAPETVAPAAETLQPNGAPGDGVAPTGADAIAAGSEVAPVTPETSPEAEPIVPQAQDQVETPATASVDAGNKESGEPSGTDSQDDEKDETPDEEKKEQAQVEESMTDEQKAKREEIVKAMKSRKDEFEKRYGDKAKDVMYATATKQAMNEDSFASMFQSMISEGSEFKADGFKVKGIMESQGLEEDLAIQAVQIFEEAVNECVKAHVEKVSQYAAYVAEEILAEKIAEIEHTVSERLDEGIQSWVAANKLELEQGVRVTVAESFMDKLGSTLKEHFVEVPDFKKNLYEENLEIVGKQGAELAETKAALAESQEALKKVQKELFIESNSSGMTALQRERMKELTADLVFESAEDFSAKFSVLKESLVEKKVSAISNDVVADLSPVIQEEVKTDIQQDPYVAAMANKLSGFAKR
jgi:hypothetical protein